MTTAVQAFKGKIADANTTVEQQETPTGATDAKAAARNDLEDVIFFTCQALAVLGHTNNDQDLLAVAELTRSDLDRMPDDELLTRTNVIIAQANTRKLDLLTLQVTQNNLTELDQKFQAWWLTEWRRIRRRRPAAPQHRRTRKMWSAASSRRFPKPRLVAANQTGATSRALLKR